MTWHILVFDYYYMYYSPADKVENRALLDTIAKLGQNTANISLIDF